MDTVSVPTLDDLVSSLGAPEPAQLEAVVADASREELTARGAEVASSRILVDVSRIYSLAFAFWSQASPTQKEALVGFSPDLLRIAVDRAVALRILTSDSEDATHADASSIEVSSTAAGAAFSRGLLRRDQLHAALRTVAGHDPEMRRRVDLALGTADDAEALAKGMKRLVVIGKEVLTHKKGPQALRAKLARLTPGYLEAVETIADEVRSTARAASGRATARRAAQGEIDFLDGMNLHLLSTIIGAFEVAHGIDPTIPRLIPIATRRALGKSRRTKVAKGNGEGKEGRSGGKEGAKPS